jgi:UDP-GlcNAc:undecaprenyl-phosphate GlcNAc-1-phosphate transferase
MSFTLLACLVAGGLSFGLTPLVKRLAFRLGAIDRPSPRKVHREPIPRLGGLAPLAGLAVAYLLLCLSPSTSPIGGTLVVPMALGLLPIALVSFADDVWPVSARLRLLLHALGAIIAMAGGIVLQPTVHLFGASIWIGWAAFPLTLFWLVGVTNAFNLIDGLDGLATGLGLISAVSLAAVFALAGRNESAAAALVFASALVGFLPHNLFPARVFLGDTGATAIGFCLACFTVRGGSTLSAGLATTLPLLLVSVPVIETLLSIARRLVRRFERLEGGGIFQPDANHIHHRLLQLGLDQPRAVALLHGTGLAVAAVALSSLLVSTELTGLFLLGLTAAGVAGVSKLDYEEFNRLGAKMAIHMAFPRRRAVRMALDVLQVAAIVYLAVALKFDDWALVRHRSDAFTMMLLLGPFTILAFRLAGLYRNTWTFASLDDVLRICRAVVMATFMAAVAIEALSRRPMALSLLFIYAGLQLGVVCTIRLVQRSVIASLCRRGEDVLALLAAGAGSGMGAMRPLLFDPQSRSVSRRMGTPAMNGAGAGGGDVTVVATLEDLEHAIRRLGPRTVVVASPTVPAFELARAEELSGRMRIPILKLQAA